MTGAADALLTSSLHSFLTLKPCSGGLPVLRAYAGLNQVSGMSGLNNSTSLLRCWSVIACTGCMAAPGLSRPRRPRAMPLSRVRCCVGGCDGAATGAWASLSLSLSLCSPASVSRFLAAHLVAVPHTHLPLPRLPAGVLGCKSHLPPNSKHSTSLSHFPLLAQHTRITRSTSHQTRHTHQHTFRFCNNLVATTPFFYFLDSSHKPSTSRPTPQTWTATSLRLSTSSRTRSTPLAGTPSISPRSWSSVPSRPASRPSSRPLLAATFFPVARASLLVARSSSSSSTRRGWVAERRGLPGSPPSHPRRAD